MVLPRKRDDGLKNIREISGSRGVNRTGIEEGNFVRAWANDQWSWASIGVACTFGDTLTTKRCAQFCTLWSLEINDSGRPAEKIAIANPGQYKWDNKSLRGASCEVLSNSADSTEFEVINLPVYLNQTLNYSYVHVVTIECSFIHLLQLHFGVSLWYLMPREPIAPHAVWYASPVTCLEPWGKY